MKFTLALLLIAGTAAAAPQNPIPSRRVDRPLRSAGTLDWATGTWSQATGSFAAAPGGLVVFDNTCNWTGGARFADVLNCWQLYDEGRIPSASSGPLGNLPGVFDCQVLCGFDFAYCTADAGPIPIQIGFVQGLQSSGIGGSCAGQPLTGRAPSPPLPPQNFGAGDIYIDLTGAGLPGSPTPPNQVCWIVTIDLSGVPNTGYQGFPFRADGDCSWDAGGQDESDFDRFSWTFETRGLAALTPNATGPVIAGEPSAAPPGAGSYGLPPGNDPLTGNPCGTGLGIFDGFWINVNGQPVGSTAMQGCLSQPGGGSPPLGSNCYFFGGYPGNPFSNFYLRLWASGQNCTSTNCQAAFANPFVYCSSKQTCVPCKPGLITTGVPSATGPGFDVQAMGVDAFINGLLFYGQNGPANVPFLGGTLCVTPPLRRTPIQNAGGIAAFTCTGMFTFDFQQWIASGIDATLQIGSTVNAQYWYREPPCGPGPGGGRGLSNAVQFTWTP